MMWAFLAIGFFALILKFGIFEQYALELSALVTAVLVIAGILVIPKLPRISLSMGVKMFLAQCVGVLLVVII